MFRRRETMIALRARRQALHIASTIANPRVKQPLQVLAVNAPPDERAPLTDPDEARTIKMLISACVIIAASVAGFCLLWYRIYWPH